MDIAKPGPATSSRGRDLESECLRLLANSARLPLHTAAYSQLQALHQWLVSYCHARLNLATQHLWQRKIGDRVGELAARFYLRLTFGLRMSPVGDCSRCKGRS